MTSRTVGKDETAAGGLYFQTYQKLVKQRERIDKEINKVQANIFKKLEKGTGYVERVKSNRVKLIDALHKVMKPGKEMSMDSILKKLKSTGLYKTKSTYLYTMVNNKLNRDPHVKKVSRGLFVYSPPVKKRKARKKSSTAA